MAIVGGFDLHRRQITFEYVDIASGEVSRGRKCSRRSGALAGMVTTARGSGGAFARGVHKYDSAGNRTVKGVKTPIRRADVGFRRPWPGHSAYLQSAPERVGVRSRLGHRCHVLIISFTRARDYHEPLNGARTVQL